ncbi:CDP-alcohol phosphatidyltransferase family protein [Paraburkholderia sacchari]|uniref:CDP-alcohol phosphatidyltransferase family protein n=1 Tax=Paraburkholderia sacchari TaxID=159450 RepID=A0A8T6Z7Z7_9BURK|nr:CDP-alcohol phosphatidyltransferase family protein [Paraburkholderia sacchari]
MNGKDKTAELAANAASSAAPNATLNAAPKPVPRTVPQPRTWDARAARWLVTPLVRTCITPNHLTTLRLLIGLVGAFYLARGNFLNANIGAFLIVLSNFVDHTDGELARISGKTSRIGHFYDLAADAVTTVLLFLGMGYGLGVVAAATGAPATEWRVPPVVLGGIAGVAVAAIFFLRMRIEEMAGKAGTQQAFVGGFETEDILYLLPLVTLTGIVGPFVVAASIGAPLFAIYVVLDYWRVTRRVSSGKETRQVWISR